MGAQDVEEQFTNSIGGSRRQETFRDLTEYIEERETEREREIPKATA